MRVSLNTIKQYTAVDLPVEALAEKINQQLGGVEGTVDLAVRYAGAVIVKVVGCEDHPDADRLHVCRVDDGGVTQGVDRDADGYVQVVCGASNVTNGIYVVWLPPGAAVPSSFDDVEPFVLGSRELRGVMSNGMLASARELGIGDDHDGILVIDPDEWKPNSVEIKPGTSFAAAYGLDDTLIDIENKMFTHRPDLFGQLGVAREIAGIQHQSFTSPDWYKVFSGFNSGEGLELGVHNDALEKVPRFMAVALKDVEVRESPLWLRCELVRLGAKPINNIVDVTNYIMLLTAQPVHAYDYDKLRGQKLGVRFAHKDESIALLNHKTYTLDETDIVIVDGEGPVGLAGIMGGAESEVSRETKNIVLEVATFDMYSVRKISMRHGLFTDALTRFNKGQSPYQNARIMNLLIQSVLEVSPGEQASQVFDIKSDEIIDANLYHAPDFMTVDMTFINERLGLALSADEIADLLRNVEFRVDVEGEVLKIAVPFWRTDIELREDIVEEVGRLYGFGALPRVLPRRSLKPAMKNRRLLLKQLVRESLSRAGANEVLTYSFVHQKTIEKAEQNSAQAFKLGNALSPDLQYYRLSLLPSLLDKVHANIKTGHDQFVLFEIGKGHNKAAINEDGLPKEIDLMELVYASKKVKQGAPYYRAQRMVSQLCTDVGVSVYFEAIDADMGRAEVAPYELSRSAHIVTSDGETIGTVGELKRSVRRAFKLPDYTAGATIDLSSLTKFTAGSGRRYRALSRFPKVTQDISLKITRNTTYGEVIKLVQEAVVKVIDIDKGYIQVTPRTIYSPDDAETKTVTLRFEVFSYVKTLQDSDVAAILDAVAISVSSTIDAERI